MPRQAKPRKIGNISSEVMENAVNLVLNENHSIRATAKTFQIPFQTLHRYVKKRRNDPESRLEPNYQHRLVFKPDQEQMLADYLITCSKMAYGLTVLETRKIAYSIAKENHFKYPVSWDRNQMAGEEWRRAFINRNKVLSIRKPEACSLSRLTSFNKNNVDLFFNNLRTLLEGYPKLADGSRVYNLDETGTQTVQVPKKIIAPKGVKQVYKCTSGERCETVTTCAIVSAIGTFLPPVLVFPGKNFKNHMLRDAPSGSKGFANLSGWMNSDIFLSVLEHFIEHTHSSKDNPTLLIYDNHESHISLKIVDKARDAGVHILTIPPHSSNKLQPLDISVFGPFRSYFNSACDKCMLQHPGVPLTIYDLAGRIAEAFEKSFTPTNIIAGFRKSGIHPFDPNVFTESDFLISSVTDRPLPEPEIEPCASSGETEQTPASLVTLNTNEVEEISKKSDDNNVTAIDINNILVTPEVTETSIETTPPKKRKPLENRFISPEELRPFPKAKPRKQVRKGRQRAKSTIITGTPEKEKLVEKENIKLSKQVKKNIKEFNKTILPAAKKRILRKEQETESDTSEDEEVEYEELSEVEDWIPEMDDIEEKCICRENVSVNCFVLVKFKQKIFYVAKVISIEEDHFMVSFLRKSSTNNSCFVFPVEEDISAIELKDISAILPKPIPGTTKRQSNLVKFGINFNSVNVR